MIMNEKELLKKRFNELAYRAYSKGYKEYTDFLNLDEISTLKQTKLPCNYMLFGGYDFADRCIACFGENVSEESFPISCVKIAPVQQKFADKLSHRDFLGALMNLGINRNVLGDIVVDDNIGYVFCLDTMVEYVIDNLNTVKHTTVKAELSEELSTIVNKEPNPTEIILSSQRVDVIVSSVFKLSRNQAEQLFNREKVFVNSKVVYKGATMLKENDIVSVRGYGKFKFEKILKQTKKGKHIAQINIYK